tara:strand:- start:692 stop:1162 length:471 start_codon:yes stop_codon:yes gene_type:complete
MEEMYLKFKSIKEPFRQRPHTRKINKLEYGLCKNGGMLKKPIISLISLPINLFLGYRTYCRVPQPSSKIFLLVFIITMGIFLFDIIYNNVSSNKKIEKKCLDIMNNRIRNNWGWTIITILNVIIGIIILYYGLISLFMNMELKNCPNNMFSTFSKK